MLPKPGCIVPARYWLTSAAMPVNVGLEHEVPPTATSDPPLSTRYAYLTGEAASETSGRSRAPSFGTPGPVCQKGLVKYALAPPPVASKPVRESFHARSGM